MEGVPYKAGVRSLVYAMVAMRADIAFAVSTVSQFISRTNPPYWMPMKHIMRYLKGHFEPHSGSSIQKIGIYPTFYKENYIYTHTHSEATERELISKTSFTIQ